MENLHPFAGFPAWLRSQLFAILLAESLCFALALALAFSINPARNGIVKVKIKGLDKDNRDYFLGKIRDADMQGMKAFPSDSGRIKNIRLHMPEGHKRDYPDSCTMELGFSMERQESDSILLRELRNTIFLRFTSVSEGRNSMNRRFYIRFDADSLFEIPSPLQANQSQFHFAEKPDGFFTHQLPGLLKIQPADITFSGFLLAEVPERRFFLLALAAGQAMMLLFFMGRFVLLGK